MVELSEKQKMIIEAFFLLAQEVADPQKITMQMIADRAGITRQNIYAKHFDSIEEMIQKIHILIDSQCMEKMEEFFEANRHDLVDYFADEVLPILYERRAELRVLYRTNLDRRWSLFLEKQYAPMIEAYLRKSGKVVEVSYKFLSRLIVGQVMTLIACWLVEDNPLQPTLFKEEFVTLLSVSTYDWLS
ncbi:hypothetical protein OfM1_05110 [Lactovum odontotermitis]